MKRDYRVVVNVFTYRGDQKVLEYTLRALLSLFSRNPLEIYIMDDSSNPMEESYVEKYLNLSKSIRYEKTYFNRNRNLNGRDCIVGMIEKFIEHAKGQDALNIKIDPDVIVTSKIPFDELYNSPKSHYASIVQPQCHFSGGCYFFKTEALKNVLQIVLSFPIPNNEGPEDYIIGLALCASSIPKISLMFHAWNYQNDEGVAAAWNYGINESSYDSMIAYYRKKFFFIILGNYPFFGLTSEARLKPGRKFAELIESRTEL